MTKNFGWPGAVQADIHYSTFAAPSEQGGSIASAISSAVHAAAAGASVVTAGDVVEPHCNLGEQLRHNKEAAAKVSLAAAELKRREGEEAFNKKERMVREFFDEAWAKFSRNIAAGRRPGGKTLGNEGGTYWEASVLETFSWVLPQSKSWQDGGRGIWSEAHAFHHVWIDFQAKCRANGLIPTWVYQYDGGGIESWWILSVEA